MSEVLCRCWLASIVQLLFSTKPVFEMLLSVQSLPEAVLMYAPAECQLLQELARLAQLWATGSSGSLDVLFHIMGKLSFALVVEELPGVYRHQCALEGFQIMSQSFVALARDMKCPKVLVILGIPFQLHHLCSIWTLIAVQGLRMRELFEIKMLEVKPGSEEPSQRIVSEFGLQLEFNRSICTLHTALQKLFLTRPADCDEISCKAESRTAKRIVWAPPQLFIRWDRCQVGCCCSDCLLTDAVLLCASQSVSAVLKGIFRLPSQSSLAAAS